MTEFSSNLHAGLLGPDEPAPVRTINPDGRSDFLLVCDHAGNLVPRRLGSLGLPIMELSRHIGWDIGAEGVAFALGAALDATVITQTYSRLVIDCNRPLGHPTSIATLSEATGIPGNIGLSAADGAARVAEIFTPYHDRIAAELDRRQAAGRVTTVIALHSFTPVFHGVARPWHAGILYDKETAFPQALGRVLAADPTLAIGDNEPYRLEPEYDYTIPVHAEARGLRYVELEIRQDLIGDPAGQQVWADRLAAALPEALRQVA